MEGGGNDDVIDAVITHTKNQGLFDKLRKDCISAAPDIPAYKSLSNKVENYVNCFLSSVRWDPHLNKNEMRETLRKQLSQAYFVQSGIQQIASQIIEKKRLEREIRPTVEQLVVHSMTPQQPRRAPVQRRAGDLRDALNTYPTELGHTVPLMCDVHSYIEPLDMLSPERHYRAVSRSEDV